MLTYIAVTTVVNLTAGYLLGVWLGPPTGSVALPALPRLKRAKQPQAETQTPPAAAEPAPAGDLFEGLAEFQAKLAELGENLRGAVADETFTVRAVELQEANHSYLEEAHRRIDASADEAALAESRQQLIAGTETVERISQKYDAALEKDDRQSLCDASSELVESVAAALRTAGAPIADEGPTAEDVAGRVVATLDDLMRKVEGALADFPVNAPPLTALIALDPLPPGADDDPALGAKVLETLTGMVGELADARQSVATDEQGRVLLTLDGDSLEGATSRLERLRLQFGKTKFVHPGGEFTASLTCALAEGVAGDDGAHLLERLEETLSEGRNLGANRTLHHDGKFPAPVLPEEPAVEARTVKL